MADETTNQSIMPETKAALGLDQTDVLKKYQDLYKPASEAESAFAEEKGQRAINIAKEKADFAKTQASKLTNIYDQYAPQLMAQPPKRQIEKDTVEGMVGLGALLPVAGAFFGGKGLTSATGALNAMAGLVKGYQEGNKQRIDFEQKKYDDSIKEFERHQNQIKQAFEVAIKKAQINQTAAQAELEIKLAEYDAKLLQAEVKKNGIVKPYNDFIETQKNTMNQINKFQTTMFEKMYQLQTGIGPQAMAAKIFGPEVAASTDEKVLDKVMSNISSLKNGKDLINEATSKDIKFGEVAGAANRFQSYFRRNLKNEISSPAEAISVIEQSAKQAGLNPNDANVVFYKKAIFAAMEMERAARGGSVLPVAIFQRLTPLLDPRSNTKQQWLAIMTDQYNRAASASGLTPEQLDSAISKMPSFSPLGGGVTPAATTTPSPSIPSGVTVSGW